jgi:hypothetical protein
MTEDEVASMSTDTTGVRQATQLFAALLHSQMQRCSSSAELHVRAAAQDTTTSSSSSSSRASDVAAACTHQCRSSCDSSCLFP